MPAYLQLTGAQFPYSGLIQRSDPKNSPVCAILRLDKGALCIMSFLTELGNFLTWPGRKISQEVAEEVSDKTKVALRSALVELDSLAPVVTDLAAGRKVTLHIGPVEIWLEENEVDTK